MQLLIFWGHYFWTVLGNWLGITLLVLGVLQLAEWLLDKKAPIPRWVRLSAFVVLLFVAQALAYKKLTDYPPLVFKFPPPSAPIIQEERTKINIPVKKDKPPASQTTINAQNGIGISGGNVSNPTVNNYAPPERSLVNPQRETFISMLRKVCPFEVAVRPISGNAESMKYADELSIALTEAGCTPRRPKFLIDTSVSYGVSVAVHDTDSVPAGADALVAALKQVGPPPQGHVYDGLEPGVVYLMVGLNDTKNPLPSN